MLGFFGLQFNVIIDLIFEMNWVWAKILLVGWLTLNGLGSGSLALGAS